MDNFHHIEAAELTIEHVDTTSNAPTASAAPTTSGPESRAAAERVAAELEALTDSEVLPINVDITTAVTQLLGHWNGLIALEDDIAKLPGSPVARIRSLRDYALALYHWQSCMLFAVAPDPETTELVARGIALRDRTLADLGALAAHGRIDPAALAKYRGSAGHRKVALDLAGLANLVHERWADIEGHSLLTLEAMDELATLGERILGAVSARDHSPAVEARAMRQRDRAFTLFYVAYQEARRALAYLRHHQGDADRILPTLHTGKRIGRPREQEEEDDEPESTPFSTPSRPASAAAELDAHRKLPPPVEEHRDSLFMDD